MCNAFEWQTERYPIANIVFPNRNILEQTKWKCLMVYNLEGESSSKISRLPYKNDCRVLKSNLSSDMQVVDLPEAICMDEIEEVTVELLLSARASAKAQPLRPTLRDGKDD